jgi:hypothetical protein
MGGGNGGGVAREGSAPGMFLHNTIIAGNTGGGAPDCVGFNSGGTVIHSGNLIGDLSGCSYPAPGPGEITGVAPLLGPLADNGGPTQTEALLGGSPAIDAAVAPCPATDQRGVPRPQLAGCDIGAFEREPSPPAAAPPLVTVTSPAKPSGAFKLGKPKLNKRRGTATLAVTVPEAGTLALAGKGVVAQGPTPARAAGIVRLTIEAKGKTEQKLSRSGTAKVKVKITFIPSGGDPNSESETVRLIEKS